MWNAKQIGCLRNTAVRSLVGPKGQFAFTDGVLSYHDNPDRSDHITLRVTEEQITTEMVRIQAEYDAEEYARNRADEYPSIADLTIALYDTDDKVALETKRAAVKTKWPKDNSGPV